MMPTCGLYPLLANLIQELVRFDFFVEFWMYIYLDRIAKGTYGYKSKEFAPHPQ
jgi:hypothetical protein